ncbi:hypothetical protein E5S69_29760 [Cupriavidus necator]|nr:hypothetical protein [Cupriavidus necator]
MRAQRRTPCLSPRPEIGRARSAAVGVPPKTSLAGCHRPKVGFVHPTSNARHLPVASAGSNRRTRNRKSPPFEPPTPPWPAAQATRSLPTFCRSDRK